MDVFAEFELDEEENKEALRWISPDDYAAVAQEDGWFMREDAKEGGDQREILFHRAAYLSKRGEHTAAYEILQRIQSDFVHKGCFQFMIRDALLTTALHIPEMRAHALATLHASLADTVANYGDQLHYLMLSVKVHARTGDVYSQLRSLILLSTLLELPEHWLEMAEVGVQCGTVSNYRIGCRVKALMLMEDQIGMAKGFVRDAMSRKMEKVRKEVEKDWAENEISTARARMRLAPNSMREKGDTVEQEKEKAERGNNDDLWRPAHLCRWTEGTLLGVEEARRVIESFCSSYSWLLRGMEDTVAGILNFETL